MLVVDTCGWIEWLTDGVLAENFAPFLADSTNLIIPTLVQFERYKWNGSGVASNMKTYI